MRRGLLRHRSLAAGGYGCRPDPSPDHWSLYQREALSRYNCQPNDRVSSSCPPPENLRPLKNAFCSLNRPFAVCEPVEKYSVKFFGMMRYARMFYKVSIASACKTHVYIKRSNAACDSRWKTHSPRRAARLAAGVGRGRAGGQTEFGRRRLGTLPRPQHSHAG